MTSPETGVVRSNCTLGSRPRCRPNGDTMLVKYGVEAHGETPFAQSTPGAGSIFDFKIPIVLE